ncbi:hypothetical protein [Marinagarivorans cellulosilyticus]|uniref:Uncharacterized protein n=1 Tax=Marinagarivorans cellulosilyticus TaxID=2721545 RepID=A0AAN1WKG6_9GAMM|nr:hypothetical protein [Marinagarivorans cellulosilyticus]BCD99162.1 hypothetical protein MARGE09_P3363 [Marinagarivorans cellulosilyticus]
MKAFFTFALLGPLAGGGTLALLTFPFIALEGGAKAAASMGMLFIVFSPIVGIIPAVTTFIVVHTQRGARQGKVLQRFSAMLGFITTAALFILVSGLSTLAEINSATALILNTRLITDLLTVIAGGAMFGVLGIVPGYICARVGYAIR